MIPAPPVPKAQTSLGRYTSTKIRLIPSMQAIFSLCQTLLPEFDTCSLGQVGNPVSRTSLQPSKIGD